MRSERRTEKILKVVKESQPDLKVVLENIHDPHNVSAILRSCDAVGVRKVCLIYTSEIFPKIGRQSSASATKWVEREKFKSVQDCYGNLHDDGFTIAASVLSEDSVSIFDVDFTRKTAVVFGNEHRGVSEDAAKQSDLRFKIPMRGMIQSLNVSVACAVTLFEGLRQRIIEGRPESHRLSESEIFTIVENWLKK